MLEMIKKIFSVLNALPAFTKLFSKAATTGKIDPIETLEALSGFSPSTKKVADTAMNVVNRGGSVSDVAAALSNVGTIDVMGQKLNTKTMTRDLKNAGGVCSILANVLDKMQNQSPEEIVEFGKAASDISNWEDVVKQASNS